MIEDFNKEIGKLIKKYREQKELSQVQLASLLGYSTGQFISNLERGVEPIPLNVLGRLVSILDIPERKISELMLMQYSLLIKTEINKNKKKTSAS